MNFWIFKSTTSLGVASPTSFYLFCFHSKIRNAEKEQLEIDAIG